MNWFEQNAKSLNEDIRGQALERQNQLTKPAGSLGQLETIAVTLSAMQGQLKPCVDKIHIAIFAGDHGIASEGVSAFPQAVTAEMIRNFARGGAAISVLAKELNATLSVINTGTVSELEILAGVKNKRIAPGTANFAQTEAMTSSQCEEALAIGRDEVISAVQNGAQLFIAGDMGIANTTSATALACAHLKLTAQTLAGPGTGLDQSGVAHKAQVIEAAIQKHAPQTTMDALCCFGGFEIAAMTGAYIYAAQQGLPILVDGFISTVAALYAVALCPSSRQWMFFAHQSAEPGHQAILKALNASALVNIGMRLGEGSGAAVAVPLLRLACALQNKMATFAEAMVSNKE
jgi:nicotinate-nucleotide--dimethylbenzimidazole phosphoribosyltransferase